jgi:phosphotransferase system HPr (HPr) family protein
MAHVRRSATLVNAHGLHARPISRIIEVARRHSAEVFVSCGGVRANGRRMLEMLMLAAPPGAELEFDAEGDDAEALVAELEKLVAEKFGEE